MLYEEKIGDLFAETRDGAYLAHCISADYALGAGIAVQFDKRYDMKARLKALGPGKFPSVVVIDNVFNLVTKGRSFEKPRYEDLQATLDLMKALIREREIKILAMPLIGCGIDLLDWSVVSKMIQGTFYDLVDLEIIVCRLPEKKPE